MGAYGACAYFTGATHADRNDPVHLAMALLTFALASFMTSTLEAYARAAVRAAEERG
jgi:hypothetical protein